MRSEFSVILTAGGLMAAIVLCPDHIRQEASGRVNIPEHVYVEADRQLDMFVSWVKQDSQNPTQSNETASDQFSHFQSDEAP